MKCNTKKGGKTKVPAKKAPGSTMPASMRNKTGG